MRYLQGFVLPLLAVCSAVLCAAAYKHIKLLGSGFSGASFLTGGVFECDIPHRRSVAVLRILYRSCVTRCTHFIAFYLGYMSKCGLPPRCSGRTSAYLFDSSLQDIYSPLIVLWNYLAAPAFDGVGLAGLKIMEIIFFICLSCSIPFCFLFFHFSFCL